MCVSWASRSDAAVLLNAARRRSLEQAAPSGHVDVHLVRPGEVLVLLEDSALPLQLRPPRNHGVQEFDLQLTSSAIKTNQWK